MPFRRRLVIVHQHDGPSIEGVRVGFSFWWHEIRLKRAALLEAADQTVPLDGREVRIPRERVLFTQIL